MKFGRGKSLLLLGGALVLIDQVIKVLVKLNMSLGESIPVAGDWFQLLFIENEGMAFGMKLGGWVGKLVLSLFRLALFGFLCWWITKLSRRGQGSGEATKGQTLATSGPVPTGVLVGLTLITAGALGNIIDCLFYGLVFSASGLASVAVLGGRYAPFLFGKVVDMLYFPLFHWPEWMPLVGGDVFFGPVFNFADSCVTVGALYLLFFHWRFFAGDDKEAGKK